MKNVKKNISVILSALLSMLITCKSMILTNNILMKYCDCKEKINMSIFNFMSKLYDVENHIYMYCRVYRSVIFYTSEKAYNQVDFYNLILSLVNQLINVGYIIHTFQLIRSVYFQGNMYQLDFLLLKKAKKLSVTKQWISQVSY
jgi:hypothetical protein